MFLDLNLHRYEEDIVPFIRNGIIIDTSVLIHIVDGLIKLRIEKRSLEDLPDYWKILQFLSLLKINNRWNCFYITPHILTEICTYIRKTYNKRNDYGKIAAEILPILEAMGEHLECDKDSFMSFIDARNPVIEAGDISIDVVADEILASQNRSKVAILVDDQGINEKYEGNKRVMVMDYRTSILNLY